MQLCRVSILLVATLLGSAGCKSNSESTESSKTKSANKAVSDTSTESTRATPEPTGAHSGGMERFKDPGVYVDGKPLGVLRFGELPVPLQVVWFEERAAIPFKAGDEGPRYRLAKQRRYRFRDYFQAMGVNVEKIRELHIYGGNQRAAAVVISGDNLRSFDDLLFRFGGAIWGKPLPACPAKVGDGKCPDQIGSVAVYVEKDPPVREGGEFYFEGEKINGIPYFGEPIRGGVRVYLDGPLAATIKRNKLKATDLKPTGPEGNEKYKLLDFLRTQGIDTNVIQEAWLIQYERRVKKLSRAELLDAQFKAGPAGSGEVLVGTDETPTHAISLHSKPVPTEDLPALTKDEIEHSDG